VPSAKTDLGATYVTSVGSDRTALRTQIPAAHTFNHISRARLDIRARILSIFHVSRAVVRMNSHITRHGPELAMADYGRLEVSARILANEICKRLAGNVTP